MRSPKEYVQSGDHLPVFLKDFHDAKDFFKTIERRFRGDDSDNPNVTMPDWIQAQCYTIDWFLWFLGQHGWTLQRSRADVDFRDLEATIKETIQIMRDESFESMGMKRNG